MTSEGRQNIVLFIFIAVIVTISMILVYSTYVANSETKIDASIRSLRPEGHVFEDIDHKTLKFNIYRSRDIDGNYYSIHIPGDWIVRPRGFPSGELVVSSPRIKGIVELIDVPSSSSVLDWILFTDEPRLKGTIPGFDEEGLRKIEISDYRAYQLIYTNDRNGVRYYTDRTYVTGGKSDCIITLLCKESDKNALMPLFAVTVTSFRWAKR